MNISENFFFSRPSVQLSERLVPPTIIGDPIKEPLNWYPGWFQEGPIMVRGTTSLETDKYNLTVDMHAIYLSAFI